MVLLVGMSFLCNHCFNSSDMNEDPLSECTYPGKPKTVKIEQRHLITVAVLTSEHGIAKGNLENSSVTVRKYLFCEADGRGPLKSILMRSNGCVALINRLLLFFAKRGLHSRHILQSPTIVRTSSTDDAMFFCFK